MATFKLVLSPYEKVNKTHSIDLRITIDRKKRDVPTGYFVKAKEWDAPKERVKPANSNFTEINDALEAKVKRAEKVYAVLDKLSKPTLQQVIKQLDATHDFYELGKTKEDAHRRDGQIGTADKLQSHMAILKRLHPQLALEDLTPEFVSELKAHFKKTKNQKGAKYKKNTITTILSSYRAVYRSAGIKVSEVDPFQMAKVGGHVASGGVPLEEHEIEKIWNYIPSGKWQIIARKCFLVSYHAIGLRPGNVLTMRWTDVGDTHITITPSKTEDTTAVTLYIPIHDRLRTLLNSFEKKGDTVFGVITATKDDPVLLDKQLAIALTEITKQLKFIAQKCGITKNITAKLARTSFAHIANIKTGRNVYGIKESLGHGAMSTTEVYLGNDRTAVDEVARLVYG